MVNMQQLTKLLFGKSHLSSKRRSVHFKGLKLKVLNLKFIHWRFLGFFILTLLLVTRVVPAMANSSHLVEKSVIISQTSDKLANPSDSLQQGKDYYQAGQFQAAASSWKQAVETYQARGEILNQVQALNYLSLANRDLGELNQAEVAIETGIALLKKIDKLDVRGLLLLAQALNTQGSIQFRQGKTEIALATWKEATATYTNAGDETGKEISKINQAQALQVLGQYRRAKSLLEQQVAELQKQPDTLMKAQGLRSLAVALQTIGDPVQSKTILEKSWKISQELNAPADTSAALFSLGNVAKDLGKYDVAWTYYQEAEKLAQDPLSQVQIQLNQVRILVNAKRWEAANALIPEVAANLDMIPPSRSGIYGRVNLAESMIKILKFTNQSSVDNKEITPKIAQFLETGIKQAREIGDRRAEAYSLIELGKLYWEQGEADAPNITQQALKIAQEINGTDLVARAAGQLGGILKEENNIIEAIPAYDIAFQNLQSLRNDIVAINTDVQFTFKESIEPIYRDFVSALLTPPKSGVEVSQNNLKKARQVIEALQLAELDNFFRDACLNTQPVTIDEIDVEAAVIYPILLKDRLEVILSIPNQPLQHYTTQLTGDQVEATLKQLYSSLSPGYPSNERLKLSQQVYNWLIQPGEAALKTAEIKTLVLIPDGFLRNLPLGALYDGKQYIIENYNIAISPGLQLFPQGLKQDNLSLLAAGLTEARQGFNPLPGVGEELQEITEQINSKVLLDGAFTKDNFKTIIDNQSFPIVHLATHGQFSSNPDETFILTWSDRISIQDFDLLFQKRRVGIIEPIELLVMSACQTAAGDNRATLGLAGFALRSGAKSTIASLWSVNDESTAYLMKEFYRQLTTNKVSKAEALRQAQLKVMKNPSYKHPYFWASFVLIGNWL